MIGISKLYCGTVESSDPLRYGRSAQKLPSHLLQFSKDKKPVVVWNIGQRCNLRCVHCYSHSKNVDYSNELTTAEGFALIDDLADFGVPVLLFSGGEPLMRPDIFELIAHAVQKGLRAVVSTNGTLISADMAGRLRDAGLSYVGISLDGLQSTNDRFRGVDGAFKAAIEGVRNCIKRHVKVGLRLTMTKRNIDDLAGIFDLIEDENIPRVCFYHLVYAGRGTKMTDDALSHEESRSALDFIMRKTREFHEKGNKIEVLTVDNHCDGPYLYLKLLKENPEQAENVLKLLKMNGGNNSGIAIGCVSWDGAVYPDQFWRHCELGNVRKQKFSKIWSDKQHPVLSELRDRKQYLFGRCAACKWLSICNGNLRVRAEAIYDNIWAPDPACYLTDEEIGL